MRASDADRAGVVERLRRAADEGRLQADEFEDRLGQALKARTYGELGALVAGLPHDLMPQRRIGGAVRRHRTALIASVAGASVAAAGAGAIFVGAATASNSRSRIILPRVQR